MLVFNDFLVQKSISVNSFTKMIAKWLRARFGLGRAGWAGLAGCLGWTNHLSVNQAGRVFRTDFPNLPNSF